MKKLFCIILSLLLVIPVCSYAANSNNSFEIELKEVPAGNTPKTNHGNNGAATAIALGSTFGGAGVLSGIGYYFLKYIPGMACGFACGETSPYKLISIENPEFITKSEYTYLIKAYEQLKNKSSQKFLIIPDTNIKPNTYNTVFFEIPEEFINTKFEIVQASSKFNISKNTPELDSDIFLKNTTKNPASITKIDSKFGILIKQGKLTNNKENILEVVTSYKTKNKFAKPITYAAIVSLDNPQF